MNGITIKDLKKGKIIYRREDPSRAMAYGNLLVEAEAKIKEGGEVSLSKIASKLIKKNKKFINTILKNDTEVDDYTAQKYIDENKVLEEFLPTMMTEEELKGAMNQFIGAEPTFKAHMGKWMGILKKEFDGKADMAMVSKLLKERLVCQKRN